MVDCMSKDDVSNARVIPVTPIQKYYWKLKKEINSQRKRLDEAKRLTEDPEELKQFARDFAKSVDLFASYNNCEEAFYPRDRRKPEVAEGVVRSTNCLVGRLERQRFLKPKDAPDRHMMHEAGKTVSPVPSSLLACNYVDRELLLHRTTGPRTWRDDDALEGDELKPGGLRLDVLLADRRKADRTPIVGELKLEGDKDPFYALIQALACVAHLATTHQYKRMRYHLAGGKILREMPTPPHPLRFDVWVLFHGPRPARSKLMNDLHRDTGRLASKLLAQGAIHGSVRRIAGLDLKLDESDAVAAEVLWAWERSAE